MYVESKESLAKNLVKDGDEKVIFNSDDSTGKSVRNRRKPVFSSE